MKLEELDPNDKNPRKISAENAKALRKSLDRWGLVEPLIWNRRTRKLVGGHQRRKQLLAIGIQEAQVVVIDIDEADEAALNITLNNPHAQGHFDDDKLAEMLEELTEATPGDVAELRLDKLAIPELQPRKKGDATPVDLVYVIVTIMDEPTYTAVRPQFDRMMKNHKETLSVEVTRAERKE